MADHGCALDRHANTKGPCKPPIVRLRAASLVSRIPIMVSFAPLSLLPLLALGVPAIAAVTNQTILTDLGVISGYWGQISPYSDNAEDYFGVDDVGLPSGCQIEQVQTLQRHAQRFPTGKLC